MNPRYIVATLVLAMLVGCTVGESDTAPTADVPFAVFPGDPNDDVMPGLLEGTLVLENGCLLVEQTSPDREADGRVVALYLPDWVIWEDGALTIGEQTYRPGDKVQFPGATVTREVAVEHGLPDSCPDVSVWSY